MKLGKVIGNVVATRKEGNLQGRKILVVKYLDESLSETNKISACIDSVGAGEGDVVLLCSSSSARMTKVTRETASDNTIIGIVDSVSVSGKNIYIKN